jgi:PAS domain S-box-containing protein
MGEQGSSSRTPTARRPARRRVRRVRLADALLRLTRVAERTTDFASLLQQVAAEAHALFAVSRCVLRLLDERGERLVLGARYPPLASEEQPWILLAATRFPLVARALRERVALYMNTGETGEAPVPDQTTGRPVRALLAAPLLHAGEPIGVLTLFEHTDPWRFGPGDLEAARLFAHHAAGAIVSARLTAAHQAQLQAARAQAAVHEVALALAAQTERQQVLDLIVARARELLGGTSATLALLDPAAGVAWRVANVGLPPELLALPLHYGEGVLGKVLATGQPRIANDYQTSPDALAPYRAAGLRAVVAVPLLLGERVIGCLCVSDVTGQRQFGATDVEMLSVLASHGALAIERADLLATLAERARQAEEAQEQVTTLARLAEARAAQLEAILDQMADAVLVVDADGRITRVNRAAERLLGRQGAALCGQPWVRRRGAPGASAARPGEDAIARALRRGEVTVGQEYRYPAGDGERALSVSAAPVRAGEALLGAVAVLRDITARRRLEAQLAQVEKLRALGELAAGVAHNFNNTLTAIMGYAEILGASSPDPAVQETVEQILRAAENGAAMVRRIQAFARRGAPAAPGAVEVEGLLREAIALTEPRWRDQAQRTGVRIEVHLDLAAVPPVQGEAGELCEVLVNLLNNAADALPNGGQITVGARPRGDRVELWVADNGIGMDAETQAHLFEPFWTTKGAAGTGLGLAVSYGIVTRHGGTMHVESTPGQGTTIWLSLPVAPEAQNAASSQPRPAPPPGAGGAGGLPAGRVLVVDDEPRLATMLAQILTRDGLAVEVRTSGEDALAACAAQRYDLVLTDVGMPGMSGLELAQALTQRCPGLPIILVTGWGSTIEVDPTAQAAAGIRGVLGKPYRIDQVRALVAAALTGQQEAAS